MPEAGVQQVQHSVLSTADVQVYRHPVLLRLLAHQPAGKARASGPLDTQQRTRTACRHHG